MAPPQDLPRTNRFSAREWLGFAGWIVVLVLLACGAVVLWQGLNYDPDAPAEPVAKTIVAPMAGSSVEPDRNIHRSRVAVAVPQPAALRASETFYPFYTVEPDGRNGGYRRIGFSGQECVNPYLERGIILSEDQSG